MNYCQEFFLENTLCHPQDVYSNLNSLARFSLSLVFLNLKNINIMCASPERFLKKTGKKLFLSQLKERLEDHKTQKKTRGYLNNYLIVLKTKQKIL